MKKFIELVEWNHYRGIYGRLSWLNLLILGICVMICFKAAPAQGGFSRLGFLGMASGSTSWGDADNDGDLDLFLTGRTTNGLKAILYLNDGSGNFADSKQIFPGVQGGHAVWGDVDNDNDLDVFLAGYSLDGEIAMLYLNDGAGKFSASSQLFPGVSFGSVVWEDIDKDGDIDLFLSGNTADDRLIAKLYLNDGNGNFTVSSQKFSGVSSSCAAWGDADNDGDLDLFLAGSTGGNSRTSTLYLNDGSGNFSVSSQIFPGVSSSNAAWGDADHDGDLDLFLTGSITLGEIATLYLNDGAGNFSASSQNLSGMPYHGSIAWGDVDKDNDLDIFLGTKLYLNDGTGVFNAGKSFPSVSWSSAAWGDADNDDDIDLFLTGTCFDGFIATLYKNDGTGGFTAASSTTFPGAKSTDWGDVDNDGDLDMLLIGCACNSGAQLYLNNGQNSFSISNQIFSGLSVYSSAWGDTDNDGDLDVFLTGNSTVGLYLNDGSGNFSLSSQPFLRVSLNCMAWGDADNDGDLDLFLTGYTSGVPRNWIATLYLNDGVGGFSVSNQNFIGVQNGSVAWGDADNDGDLDLLVSGTTQKDLPLPIYLTTLYLNDGVGNFNPSSQSFPGVSSSRIAWGDVDNDSDLDLFLSGYTGSSTIATLYLNDGAGNFSASSQSFPNMLAVSGSAAWGDADNDGDLDLLLHGLNDISRKVAIYLNDGTGVFSENSQKFAGVTGGIATWIDSDNDNDLDVFLVGMNETEEYVAALYRSNAQPNNLSSAPTNLNATVSGTDAMLSWQAGTDIETPANGLSYNLRVGTTPGADDVVTSMSCIGAECGLRPDGQRKLAIRGLIQKNGATPTWTLHGVKPGQTYYWSVQAVDTALAGSSWAKEGVFFINQAPTDIHLSSNNVTENQPEGTTVGILATTDSNEGDAFAYSLVNGEGDTDNAAFMIDGEILKTAAIFDFETQNTYRIRVRTQDANGATYQKMFTIVIVDVDESSDKSFLLWTK